ncbi:polysaccharide deacetylase family protein [Brevibacillus brevis]|uniref:Polysaccharide deacetylase family protein n=1 Tax=Brevibacillus brevis TaxID=1393 RepID=A0ABY9TBS0_BREBE|nr:polysaccharide deacetylase family protein [Brevibacillus brevis]WNC17574.1 polysaccharide deacetylase family protein [Brevibacillus brevis]
MTKMRRLPLFAWIFLPITLMVSFVSPASGASPVPVLEYHSIQDNQKDPYCVAPAKFEEELRSILRMGYHPITATELLQMWTKHQAAVPKPILLTFDDGYEDNYTHLYPILKKYHVKATIFLATSFIGRPNFLTWDEIKQMQQSGIVDFESHTVHHPNLLKEKTDEVKAEFEQSRKVLEAHLHKPVRVLAYPFGNHKTYMYPMLKKAGYQMAFDSDPGLASEKQGMFALHRIETTTDRFFPIG